MARRPHPAAPTATYRLQLHESFTLDDASAVVPYLAELGVSHVYCSPILQATPGSTHGYDVVDHTRISADLGGEAAWRRFADACRHHGLGVVVDIVPNHMAVPTPERLNTALWDVLAKGSTSPYAEWFDIDWAAGDGKLLMPVLGQPLAECLADGEISVDGKAGVIRYFDHEFPLAAGDDKLEAQHYRLAFWRVANEELNYRRFFDITTLIGVRVEDPGVFDATHELILRLVRDGDIDGLRIDHPDGLADPGGYLTRLRAASDDRWIVVEKILETDELLPTSWDCDGTTGYDTLAAVTAVLTDPSGEQPLTAAYADFTGRDASFEEVLETSKRQAVDTLFAAEVDRLLRDLAPVRQADLAAADFTDRGLRAALIEMLVQFPVYRAYAGVDASRGYIDTAVRKATERRPQQRAELDWLGHLLRRDIGGTAADAFAVRFEQTTGPATAKGVEDTAFYRYQRLIALNEVGGNPDAFGGDLEQWHDFCRRIAADWPTTMTTLSTHDTKRSEDVRARLLVLAEIPNEWQTAVNEWQRHLGALEPNTDYLLWQSLVGAWPVAPDRLVRFAEKAGREAKERTSWLDVDEDFERAVRERIERLYADEALMRDIQRWIADQLQEPGRVNALSQKLLQLTMPGVPDVYQGQELPDPSLVDPDNRRPVDYDARRRALAALDEADPKLRLTARTLRLRRDRAESFTDGYEPISAVGDAAQHAIAYRRGTDVVAVATRLPVRLSRDGGWRETTLALPDGEWHDVLTGEPATASLATMLDQLPVALLVRTS